MAQKRMFDVELIDTDMFLDMPLSTQALYFHFGMRADDEGFLNNVRRIMRILNASQDDLNILIMKKLVIPFQSGAIVITHWKLNNYLNATRIKPTLCHEEKRMIGINENNEYVLLSDDSLTNVKPLFNQKSIEEKSIEENSREYIALKSSLGDDILNVRLTDEQLTKLNNKFSSFGINVVQNEIEALSAYISNQKKDPYKNHYMTLNNWLNKKFPNVVNNKKINAGVDL